MADSEKYFTKLVDGQLSVATVAQSGEIIPEESRPGEKYTTALVQTDDGPQLCVKTYDLNGGGGGSVTVDSTLSSTSENPVQNKVITTALEDVYTQDNLVAGTNILITEVPRPVIDENTTGLYHFNDSYTDEIAGNDPSYLSSFNISYITGKFGKAIKVNGKTNSAVYSTLGPGSYNQSSSSFTFDVWLKPETTSVGYFSFYMYSGGIHNVEINNSRQVLKISEKVSGTGRVVEVPLPTLEWGTWFHFAYVNDVSTNKIYVFINGQKGYEATNTTSNSLQPCFASYSRGSCIYDELRISNVARWTSDFTPFSEPYSPGGTVKYAINNTQDISGKQDVLTGATGYDETATQVLKNVNGVLTWVDE